MRHGRPPSTQCQQNLKMADEALDTLLKPYERPGDPRQAMREYLAWEVEPLPRVERDGFCKFLQFGS
jgi:hypothetical protein